MLHEPPTVPLELQPHLSPITMRQRHHLTLGLAALAIGVLIFPACKKEEAVKALPPPDVLVLDAATRDVPVYREWVGTLDGSENAEIRARVTGYLLKRDYQEGALVKRTTSSSRSIPAFEAALAEAKSQLEQAQGDANGVAGRGGTQPGTLQQEGDFRKGVYE